MECNGLPVFRWLARVLKKHFWRTALHCHNGRNLAEKSGNSCSEWQKPEQDVEAAKLVFCMFFSSISKTGKMSVGQTKACESEEIATFFCSVNHVQVCSEDVFEYDRIAAGAVLPTLVRS